MFDYLLCPYCGEKQLNHEPDCISSNMCYTQCEHCDKHFWYSVRVTRSYDSYKDNEPEPESRKCGKCKHWSKVKSEQFGEKTSSDWIFGTCDKIPDELGFVWLGDYGFHGCSFDDENNDEIFHCFEPKEE